MNMVLLRLMEEMEELIIRGEELARVKEGYAKDSNEYQEMYTVFDQIATRLAESAKAIIVTGKRGEAIQIAMTMDQGPKLVAILKGSVK